MSNLYVIMFLVANTVVSVIIYWVARAKNKRLALSCLALSACIPAIGPLMCLVMAIPFSSEGYVMDAEESIHRLHIEQAEYLDESRLTMAVPANDALKISDTGDRRGYLLGLLRHRDMGSLREILHQAVYNADSEASHYAASAIMELQRVSFSNMEKAGQAYVAGPMGNYQDAISYALAILVYLENTEIGQLKNYTFRQLYEDVMRDVLEHHAGECAASDYENMVAFLAKQGRFDDAWQYAQSFAKAFPLDESGYLLMMQIAYRQDSQERFREAVGMLRRSEAVLSSKGLATIRFWQGGLLWT